MMKFATHTVTDDAERRDKLKHLIKEPDLPEAEKKMIDPDDSGRTDLT